jgi:hypothetical protein
MDRNRRQIHGVFRQSAFDDRLPTDTPFIALLGEFVQVTSIADQLFFTTVRLDVQGADGSLGSGTAFVFSYSRGDGVFPFLVTNKHLVDGVSRATITFLQKAPDGKPALGKGYALTIDDWTNAWTGHPRKEIDIAVCPLAPIESHIKIQAGVDLFYRSISGSMIPTPEQMQKLDAIEAITFVGYPNGVWDKKNLLPIARRGMTASPLEVDFEGLPTFLIDASVFGGSSGSPVLLFNQGMYADKSGGAFVGSRIHFLGVVAAVYFRTHLNQLVSVPVPTHVLPMAQQQEMIDLGIVFKASTVVEAVEEALRVRNVTK